MVPLAHGLAHHVVSESVHKTGHGLQAIRGDDDG